MSTKNYSGLRLGNGNVESALNMLAEQKQTILDLCNDKLMGLVAQRATAYVDAIVLQHMIAKGEYTDKMPSSAERMLTGKDEFYVFADDGDRRPGLGPVLEDEHSPMVRAFLEIDDRQTKGRDKPTRDPGMDCDVQLFMHWDPQQKCLLAHFQEEGVGAREQLLTVPGVQNYAYWDNDDDLPEGVTRQAFEQRGKIWEQVHKNPHRLTFVLEWRPDWIPENVRDLWMHLEDVPTRALKLATEECRSDFLKKNYKPVLLDNPFDIAGTIFRFADLLEDRKSDVRKERDALAERIECVLPGGPILETVLGLSFERWAETGAPSSSK